MNKTIFLTASWCVVCKGLYPTIQNLQKEGFDIEIMSMDEDSTIEFASGLNIRSVPSIICMRGDNVKVMSGSHTEEEIKNFIK